MALPVYISERAHQDVDDSYGWWAENRSFEQAIRWRDKCVEVIESLPRAWKSTPMATENQQWPIDVRQRNFGLGRRSTHRALFTVRPDMILVLRVRHLAQGDLTLDDL